MPLKSPFEYKQYYRSLLLEDAPEERGERTPASIEAERLGLVHLGQGMYGKNGQITYKASGEGQSRHLVPVKGISKAEKEANRLGLVHLGGNIYGKDGVALYKTKNDGMDLVKLDTEKIMKRWGGTEQEYFQRKLQQQKDRGDDPSSTSTPASSQPDMDPVLADYEQAKIAFKNDIAQLENLRNEDPRGEKQTEFANHLLDKWGLYLSSHFIQINNVKTGVRRIKVDPAKTNMRQIESWDEITVDDHKKIKELFDKAGASIPSRAKYEQKTGTKIEGKPFAPGVVHPKGTGSDKEVEIVMEGSVAKELNIEGNKLIRYDIPPPDPITDEVSKDYKNSKFWKQLRKMVSESDHPEIQLLSEEQKDAYVDEKYMEAHNKNIAYDELVKLIDPESGKFKRATVLAGKIHATTAISNIKSIISKELQVPRDISDHKKQELLKRIDDLGFIPTDNYDSFKEEFNEKVKDILNIFDANQYIKKHGPLLCENLTVARECLLGNTVIIPHAQDYPLADVIVLEKRHTGDKLNPIVVDLVLTSVKKGGGSAASTPERLKFTTPMSLVQEDLDGNVTITSAVEIYNDLTNMASIESVAKMFGKDAELAQSQNDMFADKYRDAILEGLGFSTEGMTPRQKQEELKGARSCFRRGKTSSSNRSCERTLRKMFSRSCIKKMKDNWSAFMDRGFLIQAVYNAATKKQSYSTHQYRKDGGLVVLNGGDTEGNDAPRLSLMQFEPSQSGMKKRSDGSCVASSYKSRTIAG